MREVLDYLCGAGAGEFRSYSVSSVAQKTICPFLDFLKGVNQFFACVNTPSTPFCIERYARLAMRSMNGTTTSMNPAPCPEPSPCCSGTEEQWAPLVTEAGSLRRRALLPAR